MIDLFLECWPWATHSVSCSTLRTAGDAWPHHTPVTCSCPSLYCIITVGFRVSHLPSQTRTVASDFTRLASDFTYMRVDLSLGKHETLL